jgi:hypothetical protein
MAARRRQAGKDQKGEDSQKGTDRKAVRTEQAELDRQNWTGRT